MGKKLQKETTLLLDNFGIFDQNFLNKTTEMLKFSDKLDTTGRCIFGEFHV